MIDIIVEYLYLVPACLVAIILHEMAHGYMSYFLGDPTPKEMGRLSFNPKYHIDIVGAFCLLLFHFGWAKPVMINPYYYKNKKLGTALVSLAGPFINFLLAFISTGLLVVCSFYITDHTISTILSTFFKYLAVINLGLGLFNLIPIPPLDGSKILGAFLPNSWYYQYMKYQKYGPLFLLILILIVNILSYLGMPSLIHELMNYIYQVFLRLWIGILF